MCQIAHISELLLVTNSCKYCVYIWNVSGFKFSIAVNYLVSYVDS